LKFNNFQIVKKNKAMSSPLETQSLTLSSLFWKEDIWLPPNMTWEDVKPEPGSNRYTNFGELWYPVPAALVIILIRAHVMRYPQILG
jgi:hypothetical protein